MKTKIFLAAFATMFCAAVWAQTKTSAASAKAPATNIMVLNSEKVFKALPEYNAAIAQLDTLASQYQKRIDDAYAAVEQMYNEYQSQRAYMTDEQRQQQEDAISQREDQISQFQQETFGPDGTMMQKRVETIKPIQDRVFQKIYDYAEANGFSVVLDQTNNANLLYFTPALDKSDEIIKILTK